MADQTGQEGKQNNNIETLPNDENVQINSTNNETSTPNTLKRVRQDSEIMSDTESDNNKRIKVDSSENELGDLKQIMLDLAIEVKDLNDRVFAKIDNLEKNFAKNIVENIMKMTDNKIKKEVEKVKENVSAEMNTVNKRIDGIVDKLKKDLSDVRKEVTEKVAKITSETKNSDNDTKFVIKMLPETQAEKTDNEITKNSVSAVIRDGLRLSDIKLVSAERKTSKGKNPGIVVATVETKEMKVKLMKYKKNLKQSRVYSKVYIENELSHDARVHQSNIRTLLKGIGRERDFVFSNGKIKKRENTQRPKNDRPELERENRQMNRNDEWQQPQRRGFRGRGGGRRGRFY